MMEEENVHVVVRIRPMQANEKKNGDVPCVKGVSSGKEVQVKVGPLDAQVYRCHRCFNPETTQASFFAESGITDLLDSSMEGYHACAFAFGQTGAGKTFTMVGATKGISHRDKQLGLIARSLEYVYHKFEQKQVKYRIRISCLEIYHEHVYDLFADEKERTPLSVREHATEGFFLEGSRLVECKDYEVACAALDVAVKNRQVGGHDLNSRSSRSHCVTEIYIDSVIDERRASFGDLQSEDHDCYKNHGKMSLIDLAGSERLKNTNSTGKVLQEAGFINRSLYVLGKVIAGLVRTNGDLNHKDVPFRDSKLTKLLISSLGGSNRTLLVACVSEAKGSQAETLRTLKFSMSCARIRNKPVKFLDPQEKLILELKDQIKRLRNENKKLRSTLLTAPASTSDKSLLGNFSPTREGDNEESSPMARASSAHGFRDRDFSQHSIAHGSPIRKKPNNAAALKKKKKQKQPEIFYKYPQLQKILKDEPLEVSSPPKSRNTAASHAHQRPAGKPSVLASSEQDSLLEVMNHDHHDSPGGGSTSSKSKIKVEVLDEMVHRRAPGPLIMKDSSAVPTLRDSRLGQYYPAENYIKTMDAKRIEILEQKIAELEDGRKKKGVQESDADTDHEHASHADHGNISVDGSQFVKKKKGKKKKTPHWKAEKEQKPSPYIAHMQKKAQEQAKAKADKLEQAAVRRKGSIAEEDSQFDEHPKVEAKKKDKDLHHAIMDELEELGLGPTPAPQQRPAPAKKASEANNQHKKPPMAPKPTKAAPVKANVGAKKEPSASHHQSLPTLPSQGKKQVIINGETLEEKFKLPKLPNSREAKPANEKEVMKQSLTEPILPSITKAKVEKKVEAKEEEEDDEEDHDYDYEFEENEQESAGQLPPSTPKRLTKKLEELEKSLVMSRIEMEDNPGDVTNDVEVKFKNMQLEAKVIRVELAKMTGEIYPSPNEKKKVTPGKSRPKTADEDEYGDDEFFEDEFEGGDAEEPEKDMDQAERLNLNVDPNITEPDEDAKKTWFLKEKIQLPKEEESPTTTRKMNISRQYSAVLGGSYEDEVNRIESELGFTNPNPAPVIKSSPSKKFNISRDPSKSSLDKSPSFNKANSDTTPQSKPTSTPVVTAPAPVPIVKTPASVPSPTRFPVAASAPTPAPEAVPAAITTTTNISPVKTARSEKEYGDEDFDNYEDEFEGEKEETPKKIVPVTMTTPTKSYDAPSYSSSKDTNKSSNNATLEKKHTPTSVTEMNDYESPKVKQITPATKAAPQDEDDEYGNDDFDDYEQSFEAED